MVRAQAVHPVGYLGRDCLAVVVNPLRRDVQRVIEAAGRPKLLRERGNTRRLLRIVEQCGERVLPRAAVGGRELLEDCREGQRELVSARLSFGHRFPPSSQSAP